MTKRHAEVLEVWGDGRHTFRLALGEWRELQQLLQLGPLALYKKFVRGEWTADEIYETLRVALIGGGLEPAKAYTLVQRYVAELETPLMSHIPVILAIIQPAIATPKGEKSLAKKRQAVKNKAISPDA